MQPQDLDRTLRRLDAHGWLGAARRFTASLRAAGHEPGRLLVVGTPEQEPWHLTAHLDDAARWRGTPDMRPVLARWHVPTGAPAHLSVGVDALSRPARGTTVLVATPADAGDRLLERLDDARRGGATLFALHGGEDALDDLVHEALALPPAGVVGLGRGLDTAAHVLTTSRSAPTRRRLPWSRVTPPDRVIA